MGYRERTYFVAGRGYATEFVVDYRDDDGVQREATFGYPHEAARFAADVQTALLARGLEIRAENRALLNRVSGRGAPKNAPRTLMGVLTRISNTFTTREL